MISVSLQSPEEAPSRPRSRPTPLSVLATIIPHDTFEEDAAGAQPGNHHPSSAQSSPCRRPRCSSESSHFLPSAGLLITSSSSSDETVVSLEGAANESLHTVRTQRRRGGLWVFRLLIIVADILVYLTLSDTAAQAAGPRPLLRPNMTTLKSSKQVFVPHHLSHAKSWENPEFRIMERWVLSDEVEVLTPGVSGPAQTKHWIWIVLVVGVGLELVWKELQQRSNMRQVRLD